MRTLFVLALALFASLQVTQAHAGCSWGSPTVGPTSYVLDPPGNQDVVLSVEVTASCTGTVEDPVLFLFNGIEGSYNGSLDGAAPNTYDLQSQPSWNPVAYNDYVTDGSSFDVFFRKALTWSGWSLGAVRAGTYNLSTIMSACVGQGYCADFPASTTVDVAAHCTMSTIVSQHVDFGTITDLTVVNNALAGSLTTTCSTVNSLDYSITIENGNNFDGSHRRMTNGTDFIAYELLSGGSPWTAVLIPGDKLDHTTPVDARTIPTGASPSTGVYTDTVIVVVTY